MKRLDEAGAVLIAKLSLGELAWGDVWFGGRTRNPWNPEQGSSGSSAGPAAATAAGCVAFSIGSETLGSIVSPSTRCGATVAAPDLRHASAAHGAMALSWTMDKLGPICRSTTGRGDRARGDPRPRRSRSDRATTPPFAAAAPVDVRGWKVGFVEKDFERSADDKHVLDELKALGVELVPVELPAGDLRRAICS